MDFAIILDIVVIVIILISSVVAFLRGLVREVLTIFGLGGAFFSSLTIAPKFTDGLYLWLTSDIENPEKERLWSIIPYDIAASVIAYIGVFVVTLILLSLISHWIAKSVHAIGLGPVDRSLGVLFGIGRGLLLIGLLYLPFHILMDEKEKDEWFGTSNTYSYVEYLSEIMVGFMPESWNRSNEKPEEDELDPLKDLTGENNGPSVAGTDEEAAETTEEDPAKDRTGYDDIQRQAIDVLIENQDKIKDLIEGSPANE